MPSTHIIRRQVLEVAVLGTEVDGFALQRWLPELCEDRLTPAIEQVLERSAPSDEYWAFERLEVDAGSFSLESLERDLIEAVTRALKKLLRERALSEASSVSAGPLQRKTPAQSVQEAFLYFLRTGRLPWWFHLPARQTLEEAVRAPWQSAGQTGGPSPKLLRGTLEAIGSASVRERLVRQFSADFLATLLAALSREAAVAVDEALIKLADFDLASGALRRFADALWQAAFAAVAAGARPPMANLVAEYLDLPLPTEPSDLARLERLRQIWPDALSRKRAPAPVDAITAQARSAERKEPGARIDLQEGVFIRCAGLVLLHPFLPRFFEDLGLAAESELVQPERALCLLYFLATGRRFAPEYELLLPKLLCNVPLEAPVPAAIELTAAEEEEAVALLEAVVRHWQALGNASIDGLRGTFLVRPGKLSRRHDDEHLLQVERSSVDILLDRLPWGFGTIKLPWMQKILWVEWG